MYNDDYIMRLIDELSGFLANVIFNKEVSPIQLEDDQGNFSESKFLHYQLLTMVGEGQINEAENLLFEKVQLNPTAEYLKAGIDFYSILDTLSDNTLNDCRFSRVEIGEGLSDLKKIYTAT
ncbi:hypothetical protein GH810_05870 [Acetobacterium paludosum]|uniref:Uncharacterized protein n=1 Tax=Acetobacterium paludosum TaxID=52693 RepID=A0A923I0F7_9FIRM|nr:DUF6483 family protein [Acetobacterium paludosum]MBC3887833.1 hypothetical protein [Acetobacterium paludosum]